MTPYHSVGMCDIYLGNCLDVLKKLPSKIAQMCCTSPPYWGLRDYMTGTWEGGSPDCDHIEITAEMTRRGSTLGPNRDGLGETNAAHVGKVPHFTDVCRKCGAQRIDEQIGSEKTPEEFIEKMVLVFREVRRVLRDDGILFCNLGDSYSGGGRNQGQPKDYASKQDTNTGAMHDIPSYKEMPAGNLVGIPWRVALALQADGWVLRSDIPWLKRSAMPESAMTRPSKSLEYFFMLTKSMKYYFDMEAVRQPQRESSLSRYNHSFGGSKSVALIEANKTGVGCRTRIAGTREMNQDGRNFRNSDLWFQSVDEPHGLVGIDDELVGLDVTNEGIKEAHFAAYPSALIRPLILAGTSEKGACPECNAPYKRIIEKDRKATRPGEETKVDKQRKIANAPGKLPFSSSSTQRRTAAEIGNRDPLRHVTTVITTGWEPTCKCSAGDPVPCKILDCFLGSGTTLAVAIEHGRGGIGIELNEDYVELSRKRITKAAKKKPASKASADIKPKAPITPTSKPTDLFS